MKQIFQWLNMDDEHDEYDMFIIGNQDSSRNEQNEIKGKRLDMGNTHNK